MKEFKVGDTVLVPMKVEDKTSDTCYVKYGSISFWTANEALARCAEEKTYDDGLNDAWEAARKFCCESEIGGLSEGTLQEIFGSNHFPSDIFMDYTAQDAIDKIKAWEDANAIRVGDIVEMMGGLKGLVTKIKDGCYYVIYADGGCRKTAEGEKIKKTGRNADISSYLFGIFGV